MARPPTTLAELRDEIEAMRDELGDLGGELLHRSDGDRRCLRVILKFLRHLHSQAAARKKGRRAVHPSPRK
jgi:hypothetical protein